MVATLSLLAAYDYHEPSDEAPCVDVGKPGRLHFRPTKRICLTWWAKETLNTSDSFEASSCSRGGG